MSSEEKSYTVREERLSAAIHYASFAALIGGIFFLLTRTQVSTNRLGMAAALFYGASLLFMFAASSIYHSIRDPRRRRIARQLDHCAIYFLITGSYAPLLHLVSPDRTGAVIFGALVLMSIAGSAGRFLNIRSFKKIEIVLYILMGWCCVAISGKLIRQLPLLSLWLLLAGGIVYTAGVAVYLKRREFSHAVWHLFVTAGAGLQFFAITLAMDL